MPGSQCKQRQVTEVFRGLGWGEGGKRPCEDGLCLEELQNKTGWERLSISSF